MVQLRRPGSGLDPAALERLLGGRARRDIREDENLREEWLDYARACPRR